MTIALHDDIMLTKIRMAMVKAIHAVAIEHGVEPGASPAADDVIVQTCAEALLCVARVANPEISAMQIAWREDSEEFWVGIGTLTQLHRRLNMRSMFIEDNTPFDA